MRWLIGMLSGGVGPVFLIGAVLALLAIGGAGGFAARGVFADRDLRTEEGKTRTAERDQARAERDTEKCKYQHEKARADSAEGVVTELRGSIDGVNAAAARLARLETARNSATETFLRKLANAPKQFICGTSEPELEYRRSVQPQAQPGNGAAAP